MSTLEHLVPAIDLCKKIPEGHFADSALIWFFDGKNWWVNAREFDSQPEDECPAPTLAELMLALDEAGYFSPTCCRKANTWCVDCEDDPIDEEASNWPCLYDAEDNYNAAAAALKLWLELESWK